MDPVKVSSKSRYALLALVELDLRTRGGGRPVPLTDLAHERGIPGPFLEQLFAALRRAGLVAGRRGVAGGFTFARRPDQVTVLDVVRALDGTLEPEARGPGERGPVERAGAADVWRLAAGDGDVWRLAASAYRDVLARTTVADLAERELELDGAPLYQI